VSLFPPVSGKSRSRGDYADPVGTASRAVTSFKQARSVILGINENPVVALAHGHDLLFGMFHPFRIYAFWQRFQSFSGKMSSEYLSDQESN
jgi:hypothetical protein